MTENLKSASSAKIGKVFQVARKELGLSKVEVSNSAFMNIRYINAIESGDYSVFPSEVFAKAYFTKYQDFLSIECEFPPFFENDIRQDRIIKKSIAKNNPSLFPMFKITGIIGLIIVTVVYINIGFPKEANNSEPSSAKETFTKIETNKIEEATNFDNLIETP